METDKEIAKFDAKAKDAEDKAASANAPETANEWKALARLYRRMAELRRQSLN